MIVNNGNQFKDSMPTYDYRCENCGHEFETLQSITAEHLKTCPECSKDSLKRLLGTGAGLLFKGSGFYQTDYRSESYKQGQSKDKKKETAKTEAKTKESSSKSKESSNSK